MAGAHSRGIRMLVVGCCDVPFNRLLIVHEKSTGADYVSLRPMRVEESCHYTLFL